MGPRLGIVNGDCRLFKAKPQGCISCFGRILTGAGREVDDLMQDWLSSQ